MVILSQNDLVQYEKLKQIQMYVFRVCDIFSESQQRM